MGIKRFVVALVVVFTTLVSAVPADAQITFVGEWSGRYHEDQPDRVPGEEPGDFSVRGEALEDQIQALVHEPFDAGAQVPLVPVDPVPVVPVPVPVDPVPVPVDLPLPSAAPTPTVPFRLLSSVRKSPCRNDSLPPLR